MTMTRLAIAFVLSLTSAACNFDAAPGGAPGSTNPSGASAKPGEKPAGGTPVDTLPLVADLPAGVEANAGVPGFFSTDESVFVMIKAVGETDPKDLETAKTNAEVILFKKWIKSEKTPDGWQFSYVGVGMDMSGKEYDNYNFEVRKKIGSASYSCYGAVKKQENVEKNLKICQSLKAKP